MSEKFKELPVEQGTKIIAHFETNLGKYEVVYEKWVWSGIYAESIIFFNQDVNDLSEDEIKNLLLLR